VEKQLYDKIKYLYWASKNSNNVEGYGKFSLMVDALSKFTTEERKIFSRDLHRFVLINLAEESPEKLIEFVKKTSSTFLDYERGIRNTLRFVYLCYYFIGDSIRHPGENLFVMGLSFFEENS